MKVYLIILLFISTGCLAQQVTKEEFLNDILKDSTFYSVDDTQYNYTIIKENCVYPNINPDDFHRNNFIVRNFLDSTKFDTLKLLPDSSLKQMVQAAAAGNGKGFHWDKTKIHASKNVFFLHSDEIDLLFDNHIRRDTGLSSTQKDSIRKRIAQIDSIRKVYNNPIGFYYIYAPIFDAHYQYAIFFYEFHCGLLCGSGSYDLYKKTDEHWKLETSIYGVEF